MMLLRSTIFLAAMIAAEPVFAQESASVPFVPIWWPCSKSGDPSPEQVALLKEMLPGLFARDRELSQVHGYSAALIDEAACAAERDPEVATTIANAWGYAPDWAGADKKRATAVGVLKALKEIDEIERDQGSPPPPAKPSAPWYTYDQNKTECFQARSPAETIAEIQSAGDRAGTKDYGNPAAPSKVDVIDYNPDGSQTIYTYWRSQDECERALPKNRPIDPKYG